MWRFKILWNFQFLYSSVKYTWKEKFVNTLSNKSKEISLHTNSFFNIFRGYLYAITMAFLPFVVLCVLTGCIVYELNRRKSCKILNRSVETFHDYVVISEQAESKSIEADTSSPLVLVLVVLLFLTCSFISLLVNICDMIEG